MTRALVFPGQGSQTVGMGRDLYDTFSEAKEVFQEVDDTLGQALSSIIFEGPAEALTSTENTQPALMATSIAVWRVLEKQGNLKIANIASHVAGHSLGEYTALAASGAISLADTARLLRTRGKAMQDAVPQGQGGMAAIIGVDIAVAEAIAEAAKNGDICQVANDNSPGQVVISGTAASIGRAEAIAKEHGAKRFVPLPVSAPFHSQLIAPAAEVMQAALADVTINSPVVPLVANVTAQTVTAPDDIRRLLVEQITGKVRWRETVEYLGQQGVDLTVEIGAGKVLSGLTKRINKEMNAVSIQSPEEIEAFLATL